MYWKGWKIFKYKYYVLVWLVKQKSKGLIEEVNTVGYLVRRGKVGSASACCKAGASSVLGSALQGGVSPLSIQAMKKWREASANGEG